MLSRVWSIRLTHSGWRGCLPESQEKVLLENRRLDRPVFLESSHLNFRPEDVFGGPYML